MSVSNERVVADSQLIMNLSVNESIDGQHGDRTYDLALIRYAVIQHEHFLCFKRWWYETHYFIKKTNPSMGIELMPC